MWYFWVLFGIGFVVCLTYFGRIMTKIDSFFTDSGFKAGLEARPAAVVLGETPLARQVALLLESNSICVVTLTEPYLLNRGSNYRYLFALSDNDADNIVLCNIGKKIYCIDRMISICNQQRNAQLFHTEKIRFVFGEEATAQQLYQLVMPVTEATP
jgi:hypothetical protein